MKSIYNYRLSQFKSARYRIPWQYQLIFFLCYRAYRAYPHWGGGGQNYYGGGWNRPGFNGGGGWGNQGWGRPQYGGYGQHGYGGHHQGYGYGGYGGYQGGYHWGWREINSLLF